MRLDLLGDRAHVLIGDGAHGAQRLGHDQIGLERLELIHVELVDRLTAERPLLDGGVDLGRAQARRQRVPGHLGELLRRGREIALVGYSDYVGADAQREQHLRGGGNEAYDPH